MSFKEDLMLGEKPSNNKTENNCTITSTEDTIGSLQSNYDFEKLKNFLLNPEGETFSPSLTTDHDYTDELKEKVPSKVSFYSKPTGLIKAKSIPELNLSKLHSKVEKRISTFWLDITSPSEKELKILSRIFNIHPLTVKAILLEEASEKCQFFPNYYFVGIKMLDLNSSSPRYLQDINVYLLVFKKFIISIHSFPMMYVEYVIDLLNSENTIPFSSDHICINIFKFIATSFSQIIDNVENEADSINKMVLIFQNRDQSDMLRRISAVRSKVTLLLRLLNPKEPILKTLISRTGIDSVNMEHENQASLMDIKDKFHNMNVNLKHYDKVLQIANTNHLSQIHMNFYFLDTLINDKVAKLTALTTILVPMTVIGGIFGMNCYTPGRYDEEEAGTSYKFIGIAAFFVVFGLIAFYFFRRYKML